MKNRFLIALVLLVLLSTYSSKEIFKSKLIFKVQEILVENNKYIETNEIKKELSFLFNSNLFLLKNKDISENLKDDTFIESFEIKRIYPNKLKIKIYEKEPIAILQNKKKKYYFTNKSELITYRSLVEFQNLPVVFGDRDNFKNFYNNLKKIRYPVNSIKSLYYFESQRWDLLTKKNKLVKLPNKNYIKSLVNFLSIKDRDNFAKYKTFDYRINDQLILK